VDLPSLTIFPETLVVGVKIPMEVPSARKFRECHCNPKILPVSVFWVDFSVK
jgi:hypothetical protein